MRCVNKDSCEPQNSTLQRYMIYHSFLKCGVRLVRLSLKMVTFDDEYELQELATRSREFKRLSREFLRAWRRLYGTNIRAFRGPLDCPRYVSQTIAMMEDLLAATHVLCEKDKQKQGRFQAELQAGVQWLREFLDVLLFVVMPQACGVQQINHRARAQFAKCWKLSRVLELQSAVDLPAHTAAQAAVQRNANASALCDAIRSFFKYLKIPHRRDVYNYYVVSKQCKHHTRMITIWLQQLSARLQHCAAPALEARILKLCLQCEQFRL